MRPDTRAASFPPLLAVIAAIGCAAAPQVKVPRAPLGAEIPAYRAGEEPPVPFVEPRGEIRLRDALATALLHNPGLAAFSWEVRAREAAALQASTWPNPELGLEIENVAGSGPLAGLDGAETTLWLSQLIEIGGKRAARLRVAELENVEAAWEYEVARIDLLTTVARAFVEVAAAQEHLALADDLVGVTDEILEAVSRQVQAGATSPVEQSRARVELEASRIDRERAGRGLTIARHRLAATWGSAAPQFSSAIGDLETMIDLPSLDRLWSRIAQSPDLALWVAALDRSRAEVDLARAGRVPDLALDGGVRHFNETGDAALVFGLGLPLPLWDRGRGTVGAARHRAARVEHERRAAEVRIRTEIAAGYETLRSTETEALTLRERVLPEAETAFRTAQDGYLRGLMRLTDVLDAERTLFELRRRYFDALAAYHAAVADIERLIGEPLAAMTENRRP
jgi:cobalt-zinc-cadmium efflux system outer membrane protein